MVGSWHFVLETTHNCLVGYAAKGCLSENSYCVCAWVHICVLLIFLYWCFTSNVVCLFPCLCRLSDCGSLYPSSLCLSDCVYVPLWCVYVYVLLKLMYISPSTSVLSCIPVSFPVSDSMTVSALVFCLLRPMSLCPCVCVALCCYGHAVYCFCMWLTCCCCCYYLHQDDILDLQLQRNLDYLDQQVRLTQHSQCRMAQVLIQHCSQH